MSKRFIDTGVFDDDWFMDLPKDAKLLWIYFITKCDHAGILKLNEKLCKVQTDIKDLNAVIKQLGNRLVTVSEHLYFIPKFIEFQYPGFPNSKVRQQQSAVEILIKYGLFDNNKLTVTEQLGKSYVNEHDNVNGNDNGIVNGIEERKSEFSQLVWECDPIKYSQEMLQEFLNYWTEKNKSGTKMRFELEKTFEIRNRLDYWKSRSKTFNKSTNKEFHATDF
jgi:hypothetical protein